MNYIQLDAGNAFLRVLHDYEQVWDATHQCRPSALTPAEAAQFKVFSLTETPQPTFNVVTQNCVAADPIYLGGQWVTNYLVSDVSEAELQQRFTKIGRSIDADVDAIYAAVQGNRGAEYALAEAEATAFKDGGYTGTAPPSVQSWATVKNQTATWATDDILATAVVWRGAQSAIRAKRLKCKEDAKSANTVLAAQAEWAGFLAAVKVQLGVA